MTSPGLLDGYLAGHRAHVWHELRQLGAEARSGEIGTEAQRVCDEMARRARHNIEVVVGRLTEHGYRFHTNDDDQRPVVPHVPPGPDATRVAAWLDQHLDAVPMTLLSWIRIVGDVWLVGTHPQWAESASADPLVIEAEGSRYPDASIEDYFDDELDAYRRWSSEDSDKDVGPFVLPLAPDRLHKENVSGGPPYGILLPDACVDALFVAETTMPFVSYLNLVFRHGGFPGPTTSTAAWQVRRSLAENLLPL